MPELGWVWILKFWEVFTKKKGGFTVLVLWCLLDDVLFVMRVLCGFDTNKHDALWIV